MNINIRKNNKGITLIALVITIIVLLILAGVSIAMLTGQNGILTQATKAKTTTEEKGALEKVQAEIMGSYGTDGKIDNAELKKNLGNISGITEVPTTDITDSSYPFTVTVDGVKIKIKKINGIASANTITKVNAGEKAEGGDAEYTDGISTAIIPEGFTVSNIKETGKDETTIQTGLVVTAPDGSQFVWVPVTTAVSDTEINGTTNKALAIKKGDNYRGLLYDFTSSGSKVKSECTTTTSSNREPALLSSYDTDTTNYNIIGLTEQSLQTEYNAIIKSISDNGGFYVGRYETSWDSTNNRVQSKSGATSANASNSTTNMWYGLYDKQQKYATNAGLSVKSAMMYGSTYDAMLHWMQQNSIDVSVGSDSRNQGSTTGTVSTDKLNNIYDILGNRFEWTTEANGTDGRVLRGGGYYGSYSPAYRNYYYPDNANSDIGSRLLLY